MRQDLPLRACSRNPAAAHDRGAVAGLRLTMPRSWVMRMIDRARVSRVRSASGSAPGWSRRARSSARRRRGGGGGGGQISGMAGNSRAGVVSVSYIESTMCMKAAAKWRAISEYYNATSRQWDVWLKVSTTRTSRLRVRCLCGGPRASHTGAVMMLTSHTSCWRDVALPDRPLFGCCTRAWCAYARPRRLLFPAISPRDRRATTAHRQARRRSAVADRARARAYRHRHRSRRR